MREYRSRLPSRLAIVAGAAGNALATLARRHRPENPRRILIAHQLLLGDTLMLTALVARLRRRYPRADIVMTVAPAVLPLYSTAPYGVKAIAWDPYAAFGIAGLQREAGPPFDMAIVPGDNRHALLARALGARWVVALAGDRPEWKNRVADELIEVPQQPTSLADIFAALAGSEFTDAKYDARAWHAPITAPFALPPSPYAVLHVGAGSPLRLWGAEKWQALATHFSSRGLHIVWSAGPGEAGLIDAIRRLPPDRRSAAGDTVFAGTLDLAQLWRLLAGARVLVALDSGIAHLAKLTLTPTVCLYGPGSALLFGTGNFWRDAPFRAVTIADYPCRNQTTLFKRDIQWVRRCQRKPGARLTATECPAPGCMVAIDFAMVTRAADALLAEKVLVADAKKGGRT